LLVAVTLMPFFTGMSGWPYLAGAVALGGAFLAYAFRLWREYSDALAQRTFRFSIVYLTSLFGALLVDHYLKF
ncbi:MAG: protoheme IX farnesyltransferase, partial [Rhodocyclaceae bacterium]|nr:protoheme IX farnesyltransferase [Rhodocyclaceae bacterium]